LDFNHTLPVTFMVNTTKGLQSLYAQVSTTKENLSPLNDVVSTTLGQLSAPVMETVLPSAFTSNALEITWYPALDEYAASYRVLRASTSDGPFEVVGETIFARFTDTLIGEPWNTYCYAVQSYNGDGNLSQPAVPVCGGLNSWVIHLPVVMK
jgi:hypothetical protein